MRNQGHFQGSYTLQFKRYKSQENNFISQNYDSGSRQEEAYSLKQDLQLTGGTILMPKTNIPVVDYLKDTQKKKIQDNAKEYKQQINMEQNYLSKRRIPIKRNQNIIKDLSPYMDNIAPPIQDSIKFSYLKGIQKDIIGIHHSLRKNQSTPKSLQAYTQKCNSPIQKRTLRGSYNLSEIKERNSSLLMTREDRSSNYSSSLQLRNPQVAQFHINKSKINKQFELDRGKFKNIPTPLQNRTLQNLISQKQQSSRRDGKLDGVPLQQYFEMSFQSRNTGSSLRENASHRVIPARNLLMINNNNTFDFMNKTKLNGIVVSRTLRKKKTLNDDLAEANENSVSFDDVLVARSISVEN